jgi:hypothetical protein
LLDLAGVMRHAILGLVVAAGCGGDRRAAAAPPPSPSLSDAAGDTAMATLDLTPNQLLVGGPPTLIVGTLGDERSDRAIRAQAEIVRALIPTAVIVDDTSVDVSRGAAGWPARPVIFGGSHVNAVMRSLAGELPFTIDATQLVIGGAMFADYGTAVIAAAPARDAGDGGLGHPAFAVYAGTGTPGTTEINAVRHGGDQLLVADAFGRLTTGTWSRDPQGRVVATLSPLARRIPWRFVERTVAGVTMRVGFPAQLAAAADDDAVADAIARGIERSAARLRLTAVAPQTVYVYPDARSKQSLTGDGGAGHAVARARALHVWRVDPRQGGPLELLVTHEATHGLVGDAWGPAGTMLMGEGLAVWTSGAYAGTPLERLRTTVTARPPSGQLADLRQFRQLPEATSYPLAGLVVGALVDAVGLDAVRDHLYGAGAAEWEAALARAGTSAAHVDQMISRSTAQ